MEHFKVSGMSCNHCKMAITKAIQALDAKARINIDLVQGQVDVQSTANRAQIVAAIVDAGYVVEA